MSVGDGLQSVEPALPSSPRFVDKLRVFAVFASAVVLAIGVLAFIGCLWQASAGIRRSSQVANSAAFTLSSALAFILTGATLLLKRPEDPPRGRSGARLIAAITSVAVLSIGLADLILSLFAGQLQSALGRFGSVPVSMRMAPPSAVLFIMTGAGLLALDSEDRRGRRPAQVIFLMVALFTIAALGVSLFGSFGIRNQAPSAAMTWPTALLFIVLSLAALSLRPERGAARTVVADAAGGVAARRLLPAALLAPLLLCILCYLGFEAKLYDSGFGLAMLTSLNSAVLTTLVWRTAGALNQSDSQTRAHQAEIEDLNNRLRGAMAETHHRVRNNLQIISALADMQVMSDRELVPVSEMKRIGSQVQALAAVHDLLTNEAKQHSGADSLFVDEVLARLASLLQQAIKGRSIRVDSDRTTISGRQASAIAVVTNELVVNALKNSVHDVEVRFKAEDGTARLYVLDRGHGFPAGFDPQVNASTGLDLVQQMASWDLQGDLEFSNRPDGGACVCVSIPLGTPRQERCA